MKRKFEARVRDIRLIPRVCAIGGDTGPHRFPSMLAIERTVQPGRYSGWYLLIDVPAGVLVGSKPPDARTPSRSSVITPVLTVSSGGTALVRSRRDY